MDAPGKAPEQSRRPFYWWRIADLADFIEALNGADPDDRMEFHPDTKLLYVKKAGATTQLHEEGHEGGGDGGGYNFSHTCPPECQ